METDFKMKIVLRFGFIFQRIYSEKSFYISGKFLNGYF